MDKKIVIAGGSGFIGTELTKYFKSAGFNVRILSRKTSENSILWDGENFGNWGKELENSFAIINLSGKSISCKWTKKNKKLLTTSRIDSTKILCRAVQELKKPPKYFIQASAIGYYGNRGNISCDENTSAGKGFLAELCQNWESAFDEFELPSTNKIIVRIGFVVSNNGGAFPLLKKLVNYFLGGTAGNGKQFISWIHISDLVNIFSHLLEGNDDAIVNCTAPEPVTNREFMKVMRRIYKRPWIPPAPAFIIKVFSLLIGQPSELILEGSKCVPKKLIENGYNFKFDNLRNAIKELS